MDRLEKYEWPLTSEVFVPSISNKNVTIYVALTKTKYVVLTAGAMVGAMNEINEIMNKGELFHTLDRRMPVQIKSKLGL
jgi:ribosomal protein S4E